MDKEPVKPSREMVMKCIHEYLSCVCDLDINLEEREILELINLEPEDTETIVNFECPQCGRKIRGEVRGYRNHVMYDFTIGKKQGEIEIQGEENRDRFEGSITGHRIHGASR